MTLDLVENYTDDDGNPAGGRVYGTGFHIEWQNGPLRTPIPGPGAHGSDGPRWVTKAPNGAFVEDVLRACQRRLEFYQGTKFKCRQNELAITHIEEALHWLGDRTRERTERGVEGTLQP